MRKIITVLLIASLCVSFPFCFSAEENMVNEFKNNLFMGDWVPAMDTEEQVKTMAENGIQYTFVWGYDHNNEKSRNQVEWCAKYGIKCILKDVHLEVYGGNSVEQIKALTPQQIYEIIEPNLDNPAVIGYNIWDEPAQTYLKDVGLIVENFRQALNGTSSDLIPFVNLYPPLAGMNYESYIEDYFEETKLDYVSIDIYPLLDKVQENYVFALNTAASVARRYNADFWIFMQSMSFLGGHTVPDISGLRFQAYISLAFGAKKIMHFCYKRPGTTGEFMYSTASVDADGETKTDLWYLTHQLNDEMSFLAPLYSKYTYLGTYIVYSGNASDNPNYLHKRLITDQYVSDRSIKEIHTDQPLLVGVFDGAMIMTNASDPLVEKKSVSISVDFRYAEDVYITRAGERSHWEPEENGRYEVILESGEGVFVEIEQNLTAEQQKTENLIDEYREIAMWWQNCDKQLLVSGSYVNFEEAFAVAQAVADTDISYDEFLPCLINLRQGYSEIISVNDHYCSLTEDFLEKYSSLLPEYFSADSFAAYDEAKSELESVYAKNPEKETVLYNRTFSAAYDKAVDAAQKLVYEGIYGDVDLDGNVSIIDVILLLRHCAGKTVLGINSQYAADLSGNGEINIIDLNQLMRYIAGK